MCFGLIVLSYDFVTFSVSFLLFLWLLMEGTGHKKYKALTLAQYSAKSFFIGYIIMINSQYFTKLPCPCFLLLYWLFAIQLSFNTVLDFIIESMDDVGLTNIREAKVSLFFLSEQYILSEQFFMGLL